MLLAFNNHQVTVDLKLVYMIASKCNENYRLTLV